MQNFLLANEYDLLGVGREMELALKLGENRGI